MADKVDADEVNDEEADLMFGYTKDSNEVTKTQLISDYLPEQNDWPAKTVLAEEHPEIIAGIEQLTDLYPEVEHLERTIFEFVAQFEKRRTSINGRSRQEFLDILAGMAGGKRSDSDDVNKRMEQLLKPMKGEDEEDS